jgi:hypothetical protein
MLNITVAPEADIAYKCSCSRVVYILQKIDVDVEPVILIYNRENNILYGYMDNIKDRA